MGVKFVGGYIFSGGTWSVFACSVSTSSLIDKRSRRLDSACLKGIEIPFQGLLTVGGNGLWGGWQKVCWDGILKIKNWICFHQWSNNQQHWGKMRVNMRFDLSNWSRTCLERVFNYSLKVHYRGVKRSWWNFINQKFEDVFASGATTGGLIVKWMILLDSTCQTGLESALEGF